MPKKETVVFGGGCFWCTEEIFQSLKGVFIVMPGYAGGHTKNPSYQEVSEGNTGHAEVTKIEYDPNTITFKNLLTVFFATHNPTTPNQQGADVGEQYRSIILYTTTEQRDQATEFIAELTRSSEFTDPIVTEVKKLETFYPAEDYHRNYYQRHQNQPYCQLVISPKLTKLHKKFAQLVKEETVR